MTHITWHILHHHGGVQFYSHTKVTYLESFTTQEKVIQLEVTMNNTVREQILETREEALQPVNSLLSLEVKDD